MDPDSDTRDDTFCFKDYPAMDDQRCARCLIMVPRVGLHGCCPICFAVLHNVTWKGITSMCKCDDYKGELLTELRRRLSCRLGVPRAFIRLIDELGLPDVTEFIDANSARIVVLENFVPPPPPAAGPQGSGPHGSGPAAGPGGAPWDGTGPGLGAGSDQAQLRGLMRDVLEEMQALRNQVGQLRDHITDQVSLLTDDVQKLRVDLESQREMVCDIMMCRHTGLTSELNPSGAVSRF
jgi:hypothetical protein